MAPSFPMLGSGKLGRSAKLLLGSSKSRSATAAPLAVDAVRLEPQLMNAELGQPATPEQELAMLREQVAQLQQQLAAATAAEASAASDVGRASAPVPSTDVAVECSLPFYTHDMRLSPPIHKTTAAAPAASTAAGAPAERDRRAESSHQQR